MEHGERCLVCDCHEGEVVENERVGTTEPEAQPGGAKSLVRSKCQVSRV